MFKKIMLALTLIASLTACAGEGTSPSSTLSSVPAVTEEIPKEEENPMPRTYPDNFYTEPPQEYIKDDSEPRGSVVKFEYETENHLSDDGKTYQKYALVYLPEGYSEDDDKKYNIMYLMHGGSDSPEWFFGGEGRSTDFTHMIDCLIADGSMEPAIIVAVSYYTDYEGDFTKNCLNFHYELTADLMPALEGKYRTYADSTDDEDFSDSRLHRAFGGFSMGAVTTWSVFENCLDKFAYFMPISGDCWELGMTAGGSKPDEVAKALEESVIASGYGSEDFVIYSGCGGNDIAEPNLTPQIDAMKKLDTFKFCDNFADGNLYKCVYASGWHDPNTVIRVMYNALPKMFG